MIFDISPVVSPKTKVWPGDTPLSREQIFNLKSGASATVSAIYSTVHIGAHVDSPSHYLQSGETVEKLPVENFLGDCQVLDVKATRGERITPDRFTEEIVAPRVLIATGSYPNPDNFNSDFAGLSSQAVELLHQKGVITIGIDTPSIDLFESKDPPVHKLCGKYKISIIEGLVLKGVPSGVYELIALPLRLKGFEGSPVRAILRSRD